MIQRRTKFAAQSVKMIEDAFAAEAKSISERKLNMRPLTINKISARRLDAGERPKVIYRYRVRGSHTFPIDMLRYDSCWPATQEAVVAMSDRDNVRNVELCSYREPTEGRWASFSWQVGV